MGGPKRLLGFGLALLATGCGGSSFSAARPEPIPYADTLPAPQPQVRERPEVVRILKNALVREVSHNLSVRRALNAEHEAINLTRFDDVVGSAWFEHRNGRRPMSPDQVAAGPSNGRPDTNGTLTVIAPKIGGITPGFTIKDAAGVTYFLKFDPRGHLHLGSAAGVIANRLFYAAGYWTPEDYLIVFDSAQLVVDPKARIEDDDGDRPMTEADVRSVLERTDPLPDGRYLAIASKLLPGKLLGPFYFSGVREDDPNDYYHHEFRRELRGLYVVSAWLNHVDMRFENTRDVYIDPPGYVRHYLFDFAASLGSGTIRPHDAREGSEYNFDIWPTMARLVTLGFFTMGWEGVRPDVIHPAIGYLPVESFDPGSWRPNWPNPAFNSLTPRDGYWGAKLVGSFTDAQIRAAVAEGQLPAAAADTLAAILSFRRDRTVAHWYAKVTPIEELAASGPDEGGSLTVSFADLGLSSNVWPATETTYRWRFHDRRLGITAADTTPAAPGLRQTIRIPLGTAQREAGVSAPDRLAELRVTALRSGAGGGEAIVYMRWSGPERGYEVVGLVH